MPVYIWFVLLYIKVTVNVNIPRLYSLFKKRIHSISKKEKVKYFSLSPFSSFLFLKNMAVWKIAFDSSWQSLDSTTSSEIERYWQANKSGWIKSNTVLQGPIYLDIDCMTILHENRIYAIARLKD